MAKKVYVAVGNHRSFAGIKEIVYTIQSALSDHFEVELTQELKGNCVNLVIDEFSGLFDVSAIRKTIEQYPNTKLVIVATEFTTSVSLPGIELMRTFNFFGTPLDWGRLLRDTLISLAGGLPPYMHRRYLGFVDVLKYCNLLATIHPKIAQAAAELTKEAAPNLPTPLLLYPQIGRLTEVQQNRLWNLPVGFSMTGTLTGYRMRILREVVRKFRRVGWSTQVYERSSFKASSSQGSGSSSPTSGYDFLGFRVARLSRSSTNAAHELQTLMSTIDYDSGPRFLFNINPPQSAKWAYSSPMRILRAVLLGQIPVISKRFHDHPLEDVAILWDGRADTAIELASRQFLGRETWLTDYTRSVEDYDQMAKEANKPFVSAIDALTPDEEEFDAPMPARSGSNAVENVSRVGVVRNLPGRQP